MNPPTLEELEKTRQKLIMDIKAVKKQFGADAESPELSTVKAGLKLIEEKMDELRARNGDR
jgi:hypothetical protein